MDGPKWGVVLVWVGGQVMVRENVFVGRFAILVWYYEQEKNKTHYRNLCDYLDRFPALCCSCRIGFASAQSRYFIRFNLRRKIIMTSLLKLLVCLCVCVVCGVCTFCVCARGVCRDNCWVTFVYICTVFGWLCHNVWYLQLWLLAEQSCDAASPLCSHGDTSPQSPGMPSVRTFGCSARIREPQMWPEIDSDLQVYCLFVGISMSSYWIVWSNEWYLDCPSHQFVFCRPFTFNRRLDDRLHTPRAASLWALREVMSCKCNVGR